MQQPLKINRFTHARHMIVVKHFIETFSAGRGNKHRRNCRMLMGQYSNQLQSVHAGQIKVHQSNLRMGPVVQQFQRFFRRAC